MSGPEQSPPRPDGEPVIRPRRAPVAPRVRAFPDGGPLRLDERVRAVLDAGRRGAVNLYGPPGSGKSTALAHLAATLPNERTVRLWDNNHGPPEAPHIGALTVFTSRERRAAGCVAAFEMAPWTADDLIEYLLAVHANRVASVMKRVNASSVAAELCAAPEVGRAVLDALSADESLADATAALRSRLAGPLSDPDGRAATLCLGLLKYHAGRDGNGAWPEPRKEELARCAGSTAGRLLRHRPVQVLLAGERVVRDLCDGAGYDALVDRLPRDLVEEVARRLGHWPDAVAQLAALLDEPRAEAAHASAAGILILLRPDWHPGRTRLRKLAGAHLVGARWAGADLRDADLWDANFGRADLAGARLDGATAKGASFRQALLRGASMGRVHAVGADFCGCDLRDARMNHGQFQDAQFGQARLDGASLCGARLHRAAFAGASLAGADFTGAILERANLEGADLRAAQFDGAELTRVCLRGVGLAGARFDYARLRDCDLEGVELPHANFRAATLAGCVLTGSAMPGAHFRDADLRHTGLAEIDWAGADLRNADLRGCSFHLGSTRSGLVGSTIPCEGSRTGFYTDDYNEQDYKPPEEIRKANLRGADLRGANVEGVDFYLVDLRDAAYTNAQHGHFGRCGAILD